MPKKTGGQLRRGSMWVSKLGQPGLARGWSLVGCMHGNIECAFIGRLGQDPELRTSAAGKPWARLSASVGRGEEVRWVSVAVFGEVAQRLCAALRKGDKVYVEGTLRFSEWTSKNAE